MMIVQSRFKEVINFLKRLSLRHSKQTEHVIEQSLLAYIEDEKSLPQQNSVQLTIQILHNSARTLLEGAQAIKRAVESEKALLNVGKDDLEVL
jgi:hemerythrin-like domain-containing protein